MIRTVPLNKLVQSPRNVRKHSDAAADAELQASIATLGLLQNLIVRPAAKGKFEVEAGERRRRAMLALADAQSPATRITQEIIARLEAGTKPWIKPWRGVPVSRPLRACGTPYRGMNVFWLWMVADMCGYRRTQVRLALVGEP